MRVKHTPPGPQWDDRFEFWHVGVIADVITHANFLLIGSEVLGLTPKILLFL